VERDDAVSIGAALGRRAPSGPLAAPPAPLTERRANPCSGRRQLVGERHEPGDLRLVRRLDVLATTRPGEPQVRERVAVDERSGGRGGGVVEHQPQLVDGAAIGAAFEPRGDVFVADLADRQVPVLSAPGAPLREEGRIAQGPAQSATEGSTKLKLLRFALAAAALVVLLALAAPAMAATTTTYHATFVEIGSGGPAAGVSCGSATISQLGHVANQCVVFNACGPNCHVRTITFDDGSTLVIHESIVGMISPGESSAAGANAPLFLEITQTIVGGTGRLAGATGTGTGTVNTVAGSVIIASGTITLP
jgi:hypothetical protein